MPADQQRRASERRLNLIFALLYRERGYTRSELRSVIPDYAAIGSDLSFERMFERDKQELRALGFPIEEVPEDVFFEEKTGFRYRIARGSFALPALQFTAEEAAVLSLAANAWTHTPLATTARRALRKLEPVLQDVTADDNAELIQPTVIVQESSFAPLLEAVLKRRRVEFDYLAASTDTLSSRVLEPWGVGSRFGSWYVIGWDTDRQAERTFRLSRIVSAVRMTLHTFQTPDDFSMNERLDAMEAASELGTITVDVAPGRAHMLRKMAVSSVSEQGKHRTISGLVFDRLIIPVTEPERVATEIAAVGPDAFIPSDSASEVTEQQQCSSLQDRVRNSVLRRLTAAQKFQERVQKLDLDWSKPSRKSRRSSHSSTERLARMLEIVRFVYEHQGVELTELAAHVETSVEQVVEDLTTLFVCGRPGHTPDQLVEASWDQGSVTVANAEEISSPVRLNQPEAAALLVGLQTLRSLPGKSSVAIDSALRKVAQAAGEPIAVADAVGARPDENQALLPATAHQAPEEGTTYENSSATASVIRTAIARQQRLRITYIVASRDEITHRCIDPVRLVSANSHWYAMAWCDQAQEFRDFRLDRICSAKVVGPAPAHDISHINPHSVPAIAADDHTCTIVTDHRARWIADQYHAQKTADVTPSASLRKTVGLNSGGAGTAVEFEAAQISFVTEELAFSLLTRFGGQVGIMGPDRYAHGAQEWINQALDAYCLTSAHELDG